ncbi:MAG TPA: LrgB family protein [Roseiarcus sp.]|nr:LrgB family protein [Roseiarcus sp.]
MPQFDVTLWHNIALLPAIGAGATVGAYVLALRLHRWSGGHAILNPTLVAIVIVALAVKFSGLDYATYAQSASVVTFALSPAVVLLAVPLFRQRQLVRASARMIAAALTVGLPTGVVSAIGIAWLLNGNRVTLLSLAPKSTTAGIAIGISEKIGGLPALTAVLVIMTGITGAVFGALAMRQLGVRDSRAVGLAMGIASHGIGTSRALQIGEVAGAFAGLGMGLNGILTAILLPIAATFWAP